ncbi:MAG: MucB/RseB C-terminal domain-containing protein [Xanthomonadales bacterium]|nr:MucB/RseB C-terminal domain-containing protein [Xanthomonadales bacterium]
MKPSAERGLLLVLMLGVCTVLQAGESPRNWLERMSIAMSQLSYQGTFVYIQGNEVETMRVTHIVDEKGVRERLVAVSGESREVIRDASGVRWVLGEQHSIMRDDAFKRAFFPSLPVDQYDQAEHSYQLRMAGKARIAGHQARLLNVIPKDRYRYGYSLWLEQHTGLLLKWELLDAGQKPLAKLMFTDLRLGSQVDPKDLVSNEQLQRFRTVKSALPAGNASAKRQPRWAPNELPPGFRLALHRYTQDAEHGIYEHLVYSDGFAAVSVYVEAAAAAKSGQAGLNRMGTTHAFTRVLDDMLITVVGDVPAVTVKFIGDAVGPAAP